MARRRTRRAFLGQAGALGLAAAGLAALGPEPSRPVGAAEWSAIRTLAGEVVHRPGETLAAQTGGGGEWQESPVIPADFPFTHAGLHWRGARPLDFELRTSQDGQSWSAWARTSLERRPEETPAGEWFAALVGAPRARFAQYRLPSAGPFPEQVTLTYLNTLDGPRQSIGERPGRARLAFGPAVAFADGADFRTGVLTREQWGADEALRLTAEGQDSWPPVFAAPRAVVVHHTATRNDPDDPAAEVRAIYYYHAITQNFGDIGYNALIDRDGRIYEGRRGRETDPFGLLPRDVLSFGVAAGHTLQYNYGSVGIALLGDYQTATPPEAMLRRLEDLLAFEHRRHQIDPRAGVDFVRELLLWRYDLPALAGHRDCNITECPGDQVYRLLPGLRQRVAERIGAGPTSRAIVEAPGGRNLWLGPATFQWTGAPPYDLLFEGFLRPAGTYDIERLAGYDERSMPVHSLTDQTRAAFDLQRTGQYTLHLRADDQVFADRRTVLAARHVVRDNSDQEGVERQGAWNASRSVQLYNGANYESASIGSGARFTWHLAVPEGGRYQVQACWTSATDHATDAPYTISRDGVPLGTVRVDQTTSGGLWMDLAEFEFQAGQTCSVSLGSDAAGDVVIADAVRLWQVGP